MLKNIMQIKRELKSAKEYFLSGRNSQLNSLLDMCLFLLDPFQVNANLLLETEEVRQSISQLNTEVFNTHTLACLCSNKITPLKVLV